MNSTLKLHRGRYAHTLFCDDIRWETNGKAIFVGAYDSELYVPSIPATLPNLSVFVTVSTPVDMPIKALTVRLLYGDDVIAETPVPDTELYTTLDPSPQADELPEDEDTVHIFRWNFSLGIAPFVIDKQGVLRVRVETESEVLPGGALLVMLTPPSSEAK